MSSTQEKVWKAIYNTYIIVKDVNALTLGCQEYGLLKFLMDDTNSTRQACWGPQTAEASDSPSWLAFRDSEFASLWAPLVTRTLARGIRNGDSPIGRRKKISGDTPIWKIILPKTSKRNENIVSVHQPRGKNVRQLTNTKKKKKWRRTWTKTRNRLHRPRFAPDERQSHRTSGSGERTAARREWESSARKRRPAIHRLCLFQKKSASFTYSNRGLGTRVHLATRRDTDLFSYDLFV